MTPQEIKSSVPPSQSDLTLEKFGFSLVDEYIRIISESDFNKQRIIFDAATGSGRLVSLLSRFGFTIVTGDISLELKEDAMRRITSSYLQQIRFVLLNMEELPFRNSSVNSITCVNTFHHLERPIDCFKELIRIHAADGKFLAADFNKKGYDVMDDLHMIKEGKLHPRGNLNWNELADLAHKNYRCVKTINTSLLQCLLLEEKKSI